jgi:transcriptional regulator of acetoin/glycerol metabolism
VRNQALERGQTAEFSPSELVQLGGVMLLVQKRSHAPTRRIWTHGYFETRLEEECLRAERFKTSFALLRVEASPELTASAIEEKLSKVLRLVDVVGAYGPGVYQVLLSDTQPEDAQLVAGRLVTRLRELGDVRVGVACYARDGRSADVLSAKASQQLHGDAEEDATPMRHLHQIVERVAASTINVLILGETGVGKEKLAQAVPRLERRGAQ